MKGLEAVSNLGLEHGPRPRINIIQLLRLFATVNVSSRFYMPYTHVNAVTS